MNPSQIDNQQGNSKSKVPGNGILKNPFALLEEGVYRALETYSNVHRGSGQKSMLSTQLFEEARVLILDYLGLKEGKYLVIFSNPRNAKTLLKQLNEKDYYLLSSEDIGLPIGVRALIVKKGALRGVAPIQTGGGTTKLVSFDWVIWAKAPAKFEAGTPAIINIITFVRALQMIKKYGDHIFKDPLPDKLVSKNILYAKEFEKFEGHELLNRLLKSRIGANIVIPTISGENRFINMDSSASTTTFEPIWDAYRQTLHQSNKIQMDIVQDVKNICATFLGAPRNEYEILFTSNTTEAINLAAENLGKSHRESDEAKVLSTLLEHSSNDLPWRTVPGHSVIRLTFDENGNIDLAELENILKEYNQELPSRTRRVMLVAVSGASNVLGICTKINLISEIVHKYGAKLLVDAAQLVAHRGINMKESEIDYLAFSAHKAYAPFGCGVLAVKKELISFKEEEMMLIRSSGEENRAGIASLGSAISLLNRIGMEVIKNEEQALTVAILSQLEKIEGLKIHGIKDPQSPEFKQKIGVIALSMDDTLSFKVGKELAYGSGIGIRVGCHCAHITVKHILNVSPGLMKFQRIIQTLIPKISFPGIVRVSLGLENTMEDVNLLTDALQNISVKSRSNSSKTEESVKLQIKEYARSLSDAVYNV